MSNNELKANLPLVLFDDECLMCTRFKQALEKLDTKKIISFASIYDDTVYETFPNLDKAECQETVHLIDKDLNVLKGPEVIEYLVLLYPGAKKIAWLLESDIGKKAVDLFYSALNNIKKSPINKCPSCRGQ